MLTECCSCKHEILFIGIASVTHSIQDGFPTMISTVTTRFWQEIHTARRFPALGKNGKPGKHFVAFRLNQGWANSGPQAKCGPPRHFQWPAGHRSIQEKLQI